MGVYDISMSSTDDDRGPVKHVAVGPNLGGQSAEGVSIALDLEADEVAVDDGDVSPPFAVVQS